MHARDAGWKAAAFLLAGLLVLPAGCLDRFRQIQNERTGPGESALDYLSSKYAKIVVEIDSVSGSEPNSVALTELESALRDVTGKSVTVDASSGVAGKGAGYRYSFSEIADMEKANRKHYSGGDTAALYLLYVEGSSTEDTSSGKVLGAAYRGSSIVMFKGNVKSVTRADGSLPLSTSPEERCVERAVIVHEAGHNLGLVNNGIHMQAPHEDADHPKHSNDKSSVMYWAVENTADLFNIFGGGCNSIPYQFDSADKSDLSAARSG